MIFEQFFWNYLSEINKDSSSIKVNDSIEYVEISKNFESYTKVARNYIS